MNDKTITQGHDDRATIIMNKYGAFYAFSKDQLTEGMKKHGHTDKDALATNSMGMVAPKGNMTKIIDELNASCNQLIDDTKAKYSKEQIIKYELNNYESYFTGDPTDAIGALKAYGYSEEEVLAVFGS